MFKGDLIVNAGADVDRLVGKVMSYLSNGNKQTSRLVAKNSEAWPKLKLIAERIEDLCQGEIIVETKFEKAADGEEYMTASFKN